MNKKITTSLVLIILFILFICLYFSFKRQKEYKIIRILEADKFYIDINKNSIADDNELFKLKDISAFYPVKNNFSKKSADDLNLSEEVYLKTGYLARMWAKDNLEGKNVKIISKLNKNTNFVDIELDGENIALLMLQNGLAFMGKNVLNPDYYQFQNLKQIKENAHELSKINFYLLNKKSGIYHKLKCEYAKKIMHGELISKKDILKLNILPCKNCIIKEEQYEKILNRFPKNKNVYKKSFDKVFNNIHIFLINPLENKKPDKNCNTQICRAIVREINNAKESIDFALFNFGEQEQIFNALKAAKMRGVKIRCVIDYSKNSDNIYPYNTLIEKEFDTKRDSADILMHNKFFIFDNKKVLTGSMNISSTGSGGYNSNVAIIMDDIKISEIYKEEFEQMFSENFSNNKRKIEKSPISVSDSILSVYFSPKDDILNNVFLNDIKNAKSHIYISIFYLTNKKIIEELINAKKRGVNIIIISDSLAAQNFKEKINSMRREGIIVMAENWGGKCHEKTMTIDSKIFITGSANFSNNAFYKNDENVIRIENPNIAKFYEDYFLYLLNSIDKKFLISIPRAESFDSINSCYDGIDNNFDGKIDSDDEGCKIQKIKK